VKPLSEPEEEMMPITQKETMACREKAEARLEEEDPASVDMKPEVAQDETVPVEDATVMPVGQPKKKRRRDRNQQNMNKRTQGKYGC
jgi:hypothetical protein